MSFSINSKLDDNALYELRFLINGLERVNVDVYNARCPVCGDSKKDILKKRFFIYRKNGGHYKVHCHNCCTLHSHCNTTSLSYFVKVQYPELYQQIYKESLDDVVSERFKTLSDDLFRPVSTFSLDFISQTAPKPLFNYPFSLLNNGAIRLDQARLFNPSHPIVQYVDKRCLPPSAEQRLYVTNDFKALFSNSTHEESVTSLRPHSMALVIPCFKPNGDIQTIQGRFLSNTFRFLTVKIIDEPKIFGMERVDDTTPYYVVEAPIDSLHLQNAVASLDAALPKVFSHLSSENAVMVYDNQPRNKSVVQAVYGALQQGLKTVIFDSNFDFKDLNDAAKNGWSDLDIEDYLSTRIFSGDCGLDFFYNWKKV